MNTKKIFSIFLLFITNVIYCGGNTQFDVSGQTYYQLTYGQTSVDARLDFTYSDYNNDIDYSFLSATLDNSPYMMYQNEPAYRTFANLGVGTHTIVLKLNKGYNNGGPSYVFDEHTVTITVEAAPQPQLAPKISYFSQSPDPVYNGGTGTVYVHLSQGTGDITYSWYLSYTPSNMTASITPQGDHSQVQYYIPYNIRPTINFTCVVSNSLGTDVKSYQLNVAALYPYTW